MSESMKITGSLHLLGDTQTFNSGFTKREFVVKVDDGKFDQFIKLELVKDRIKELDEAKVGDEITVHFNIRGREHDGRFFNNLVAWRIESASPATNDPGEAYKAKAAALDASAADGDEIPF